MKKIKEKQILQKNFIIIFQKNNKKKKKQLYDLNKYSNNEELIPEKPLIFNNNTIYYENQYKE